MEDDTVALNDGVSVHAGFPNPALDRREQGRPLALDINNLLVKHPSSTYLFRISGHSWASEGVFDGDIAVVDRAPAPQASDLVISWQDSGFTVTRYRQLAGTTEALGVIVAIIHQFRK